MDSDIGSLLRIKNVGKSILAGFGLIIASFNIHAAVLVVQTPANRTDPYTSIRKWIFHGKNQTDALNNMNKLLNSDELYQFRLEAQDHGYKILGGCINPGWFATIKIYVQANSPVVTTFASCGAKTRAEALFLVEEAAAKFAANQQLVSVSSGYDDGNIKDDDTYIDQTKYIECMRAGTYVGHYLQAESSYFRDVYFISRSVAISEATKCNESYIKEEFNMTKLGVDAVVGPGPRSTPSAPTPTTPSGTSRQQPTYTGSGRVGAVK